MARVLVIDDEVDVIEVLAYFLGELGYDVVAAADPREGLEAAVRARPDLVICDVMMPMMNGYEVSSRIKADPRLCATPIVLVSAANISHAHGYADAAVQKPFDFDELELLMVRLLAQHAKALHHVQPNSLN